MSDRSFSFRQLQSQFGLGQALQSLSLGAKTTAIEPSSWLLRTLEIAQSTTLFTEKERSERLISPILLELREQTHRQVSIFSGFELTIQPDQGLNGECDFIVARSPLDVELQAPICTIVEAKRGELESALAQCSAQVWGAYQFNQKFNSHWLSSIINPPNINHPDIDRPDQESRLPLPLFGCVTAGEIWRFLQLMRTPNDHYLIAIDRESYYLDQLPTILGILHYIAIVA